MSEAPALQALEVRKVFHRDGYDLEVLKGISLSLLRGETAGVVGISGAALTGDIQPIVLIGGVVLAVILFVAASVLFHIGVKRYNSASS